MIDRIIQLSLHLRGVAVLLMLAVIGYASGPTSKRPAMRSRIFRR